MSYPPIAISNVTFSPFGGEYDGDPRGLLRCWEPPIPRATYVLGVDPTVGITGWHRSLRTQDDERVDNAAVEVIRLGVRGASDVQVAEYAAPISPMDLAPLVYAIGTLYKGASEQGQAHLIHEMYPGPGLPFYQELVHRYGYQNFFIWKFLDTATPRPTDYHGWHASGKSQRDLWVRGHHHILKGGLIINSPWLREEMADTTLDTVDMFHKPKLRGVARAGAHDDRVYAMLMALWAAHDWSLQVIPPSPPEPELTNKLDYQAQDISLERMYAAWDERFSSMLEDG